MTSMYLFVALKTCILFGRSRISFTIYNKKIIIYKYELTELSESLWLPAAWWRLLIPSRSAVTHLNSGNTILTFSITTIISAGSSST
jgi:hypothetical protein